MVAVSELPSFAHREAFWMVAVSELPLFVHRRSFREPSVGIMPTITHISMRNKRINLLF